MKRLNLTKTNQIQSLFTVVSKTQVAGNSVGQCYFSTVSTGLGKTKPGMLRSFAAMMLPEVLQIHFWDRMIQVQLDCCTSFLHTVGTHIYIQCWKKMRCQVTKGNFSTMISCWPKWKIQLENDDNNCNHSHGNPIKPHPVQQFPENTFCQSGPSFVPINILLSQGRVGSQRQWYNLEVVDSIHTLARHFLCPCVGPFHH